ncbi:SDR family oxidoreductase [Corynebacterium ulceribovis]|uniref:SDR family oxidoreductase n=1 Tax=Corynebacterium ulceribovis TaxID=487732 RepID=UPI0003A49C98|nr:SDR family oxidoreductase [Corynebacterium ulceribovis]
MGRFFGRKPDRDIRIGSGPTVITGAASGIGRALAERLADTGRTLVLADRDAAGLEQVASYLGPNVHTTAVDITDHDAVEAWAQVTVSEHGAPSELFHIAGISIWGDPVALPIEKWRSVIDVNLMGTVNVVTAFLPSMTEANQPARIMCTSSAAGIIGLPWHAAYSASKAGVIGLCEVLRFDLRRYKIDVHVLAPGAVDTPLVRGVDIHGVDRSTPRAQKATAMFQKHGRSPEDVADKIVKQIRRGRFLLTTSAEVNVARTAQLLAPWLYVRVMRGANRLGQWVAS